MLKNDSKESKRDLWVKRIEDYKNSNLTAAQWCEEHQLNIHTLKYWIQKFNKENKQKCFHNPSKQPQWLAIETPASLQSTSEVPVSSGIQISINSCMISVAPGFDQATLKEVLYLLKKC